MEPASEARAATALQALRDQGVRLTAPRRIIVGALAEATPEHLSPAELASRVQQEHPDINASTVYRCLDLLRDLHVVSHSHVPGGAAVYHLHDEVHQHLVCNRCGAIVDVPLDRFQDLARGVREDFGFDLHLGHDALTGRCEDCAGA